MRGPDQLWLLKTGSQSYLTKQWSICLPLAWNYCCRFKLGKFFASFPELLCTVCSLVKTAAVFCKGNCILMVDGDEPRMRKCRKHCQKGTTVSLFYHMSEMLMLVPKSSSWRNEADMGAVQGKRWISRRGHFFQFQRKMRFASFGDIIYPITQTIWKVEEGKSHYMDFWCIPSSKQSLSKLDFQKISFFLAISITS